MASFENSLKYESEEGGARRPAEPVVLSGCGSPGGFALPGSPRRLAPPCVGSFGSPRRLAPPLACPPAELPVRRKLPHGLPPFPVAGPIIQFVTINAAERGGEPFLPVAAEMLESARFYHEHGRWFLNLFLIMPDHLHMLASFPNGRVKETCGAWKGYLRKTLGVRFQSDCFEHRIRNEAEFAEKQNYICQNPVRKGLVASADEWLYWMSFNSETGEHDGRYGGARRPAEDGGASPLGEPQVEGRARRPAEPGSGSPRRLAPPLAHIHI